jgi:tRNA(Ile)-lysidine synthase
MPQKKEKKKVIKKEAIGAKNFTYKDITGKTKFVTADNLEQAKAKVKKFDSKIDLNTIKNQQFPAQFLLHQLGFFGFNKYQIEDLLKHIYLGKYGNIFYSAQYKLFVNKNQIEIIENSVRNSFSISIESLPYNASMNELNLSIELVNHPIELKQANTFYIGLQTIELPIKINTINAGDLIQPYGMKGHKTIGNYFTDKKLSHKLREKAFKLIVNDQIAALIPYCIDQKFAVTEESKFILKIAIKKT